MYHIRQSASVRSLFPNGSRTRFSVSAERWVFHTVFTSLMCYREGVKPLPAPYVPGATDAERMDNAVRRMFSVSKEEVLRREAKMKREHGRKKRAKKSA